MKEEKRKPGQPKKDDGKEAYSTRIDREVKAIIRAQPNQAKFIEDLVLNNTKGAK